MRNSLVNIIIRNIKKLFRKRVVITKEQRVRLTKPSLIDIARKVLEEEIKEDKLKSSLKEKIENLTKDLDSLNSN
ncbi:hypothetical protein V3A08_07310 [Tenacibaculum maritimum]|uniref:hypothetical protein n=1 Tax=Tenacibaculum maritimum TaxID=107401 RepID=UPI002307345C|nr:hypothetical protein [Tenacibaculum maritimum]MDB0600482.1 hypothetical protein [Tenacibaculum maritimum]MDB0610636.1 hypothetical protein [Tenacibaculum maritimum]